MFLAESVEAGVTLHAFLAVDSGALHDGIDVDGAHGTDVGAVAAGYAFVGVDLHAMRLVASIFKYKTAAMTHRALVMRNGASQLMYWTALVTKGAERAPPILPSVFMTAETEPAKSPPISRGTAQETPTVHSRPNNASE